MLPRRHIRIKVFQSLYAYSQQNQDKKFNITKEFNNNLEGYANSYYFIIHVLRLLKKVAIEEINIKQKNFIPSKEDLKPNKRFIENFILKNIKEKRKISSINVEDDKLKSLIKTIFKSIKKTKSYIDYMHQLSISKEDEKKIIFHILKKHFIRNEKIYDFAEECSIYWNDDMIIAYNFFTERINNDKTINTIELFRKKEDKLFGKLLLKETIKREKKISEIIYKLADNWERERIALIDLILMRMAIIEMMYINNIPNKVTLDEYIEISKQYSTPKSKEFINGILDVFIKEILPKNLTES